MSSAINKAELISKLQTLEGLSNEERSSLIGLLRQHKKYGLVWEDKTENIEERLREELPVLREVKEKAILSDEPDAPNHILIEGDNLEALTALSYTHEGKIDVIYIDPPYKEDIAVNSVEMILSLKLLKEEGIIIIETDEKEREIDNLKKLDIEIYDCRKYGRANLIFLN